MLFGNLNEIVLSLLLSLQFYYEICSLYPWVSYYNIDSTGKNNITNFFSVNRGHFKYLGVNSCCKSSKNKHCQPSDLSLVTGVWCGQGCRLNLRIRKIMRFQKGKKKETSTLFLVEREKWRTMQSLQILSALLKFSLDFSEDMLFWIIEVHLCAWWGRGCTSYRSW